MAKILVIDDEEPILWYFQKVLKGLNYEVATTNDSAEGCRLAQDPGISMIISDLTMMRGLSELALIRELRRLRPDCPLVVISGHPTHSALEECEKLGVRDFLTKPFELSFIADVIKRLLGEPSGAKQS